MEFAETALSLPIYPQLTDEEMEYVIKAVKHTLAENF
jgi:dTDP-4-amino-4,6-dideoxygalactose transaminase